MNTSGAGIPAAVGLVGLGVMGGSLARALTAAGAEVRGYSPDSAERAAALAAGAIQRNCATVAESARDVDWWIVATPLSALAETLAAGAGEGPPRVMDVMSLQAPALAAAREAGIEGRFVTAHPMAGSERSGFGASSGELFAGATVWLSASEGRRAEVGAAAEALWHTVGARPQWIEPRDHDLRMAAASHLPQLVSNALARVLEERGLQPDDLGPGGQGLTRLAGSSPALWRDLLACSASDVAPLLRASADEMQTLATLLDEGDLDAVEAVMQRSRELEALVIVRVPGDKSISQRALILAALAEGESLLRGVLPSADPRSTRAALCALGVSIPPLPADGSEIRIDGRGLRGLTAPDGPLDLGNSGTGTRLMLGLLAAQPFETVIDGDASLRGRPMGRVTRPLTAMGARFVHLGEPDRLPIRVEGSALKSFDYEMPVASAQVKSALLLAGVAGGVPVGLTEPGASRDHTERMLRGCGVPVLTHVRGPGRRVELRDPPERLKPLDLDVPGDLSSAAFVLLAGLLGVCRSPVTVEGVGLNPTRDGVLGLFRRMGARVDVEVEREAGGEPVGRIRAVPGPLVGIEVTEADVTAAIDEIPAVAVAAVRAAGVTRIRGAAELRVKETDRIRALALNLRALGVEVHEVEDGLDVQGTERPLSGRVETFGDHRMAMVFGVLGAQDGNHIEVDDPDAVDVSFPGFWELLEELSNG